MLKYYVPEELSIIRSPDINYDIEKS